MEIASRYATTQHWTMLIFANYSLRRRAILPSRSSIYHPSDADATTLESSLPERNVGWLPRML